MSPHPAKKSEGSKSWTRKSKVEGVARAGEAMVVAAETVAVIAAAMVAGEIASDVRAAASDVGEAAAACAASALTSP